MSRALLVTLLAVSPLLSESTFADVPDVSDAVLKEGCDAARALDGCPTCTCQMRTSTSPYPGVDERTSDLLIGLVVDVAGKRADGKEFASAHVLLGTSTKLTHVGRVATSEQVDDATFVQYDIQAGRADMHMCPGDCDFDAVGLVHPFEVTTTRSVSKPLDDGTVEDDVTEETRLVVCFESASGPTCASVPLAFEARVVRPAMAPGMKTKVLSREGFKRTWKFGKAGDVAFGKATGKAVRRLANAAAHKVPVVELGAQGDAKPVER